MTAISILTEKDLRGIVLLDAVSVACIEDAFYALATRPVVMPPILRLDMVEARGEVDVKTAYIPGLDGFAIKISPGFFDNPKLGIPSTNGLMVLFSTRTGLTQALLLDNGYLTDVRTAAAGAVAAKHLSRPDSSIAAIFGAGMQAGMQLQALSARLGILVTAEPDAEKAVRGADIIVTTTPSSTPLVKAEWLAPGQHLTAMGSDAEHKNEVDPRLVLRADLYVADRLSQTRKLGELHHAIAAGLAAADQEFAELGDIVAGLTPGRSSADDITYADLTGTGIQDTAIATLAYARAQAKGAGTTFET
jgi:ornithine cyclodeaminase